MGKTDETRKRIVLAAVQLAKEHGPENISVKQIYEKAGISKNTFYQYFNNKEEVFGNTYSTSDEAKMAALSNILLEYDSPLEQFWEFIKIDINRQIELGDKVLATMAIQNLLHNSFNIESEDSLRPSIKIFLSMIQKMQRMDQIGNMADPFLLLRTMYGVAVGTDIRWTKTGGSFDLKKELFDEFMAILQPKVEIRNYE